MSEHKHELHAYKYLNGTVHLACECGLSIFVFRERVSVWNFGGQKPEHLGAIDLTGKTVASCYTPDSCTDPRD
jgi:hypothetical protein